MRRVLSLAALVALLILAVVVTTGPAASRQYVVLPGFETAATSTENFAGAQILLYEGQMVAALTFCTPHYKGEGPAPAHEDGQDCVVLYHDARGNVVKGGPQIVVHELDSQHGPGER